ncbi:SpaH/EbpB family LPXTG-anchored major pilin [Actinomycetaceae bacterium L2_0104]
MKISSKKWGFTALGSGIAIASLGLIAVGAPALAAPGEGGTGSITIHKYEQPTDGDLGPADGSDLGAITGQKPVSGVEFSICEIGGLDLAGSADWERISDLGVSLNAQGTPVLSFTGSGTAPTLGSCTPLGLTDGNGETVAAGLAADRAYVVYESGPLPNTVYLSQPAIVSVPFPGNGQDGQPVWNYNPHIYPKNVLAGSGATKNAEVIGANISFDISIPINHLGFDGNGDPIKYTQFEISDQLNGALSYQGSSVTLAAQGGGDVPLAAGDYTVTEANGLVKLVLNASGLAKLDANIGGTLVFTIDAVADGSGDTSNTATITVNGKGGDVEVPEPQKFHSGAHVLKTAMNKGASSAVPLGGATFELYSNVDAAAIGSCPANVADAASTLKKVDTGSVGFVSASGSGATPNLVLAEGDYCVYETGVPAGYKGVVTGTKLTVASEDASVTIQNTQIGSDEGDLPSLPLTGATGQILMLLAAVILLAVGGGLYLMRRRREGPADN